MPVVDAFIGMNDEHIFALVETINGAHTSHAFCKLRPRCATSHQGVARCAKQIDYPRLWQLVFWNNAKMRLALALVLDAGGQTDHKLSSRIESVDFEGAAKLADS
jgi:hypothetical protein